MKEAELRKHITCCHCHKPFTHSGLPLFWKVTVERFGVDAAAIQRQHGMTLLLGSPALAAIMGPNEDMAEPVMDPVTLTLCEPCAMGEVSVAAMGLTC